MSSPHTNLITPFLNIVRKKQSFNISNITKQLRLTVPRFPGNSYSRFNPSIQHLQDNIYVIVYRLWVSKKKGGLFTPKNGLRGTPWGDKWDAQVDTIGMAGLFRSPNGEYNVFKERIAKSGGKILKRSNDARLFKHDDKFFISVNDWGSKRKLIATSRIDFDDPRFCFRGWCTWINRYDLDPYKYTISNRTLPCLNLALPTEKNWGFYWNQNGWKINYSMSPFIVISTDKKCKVITNQEISIFSALKNYYNNKLFVSVSVPPIDYDSEHFLGVGHMKYDFREMKQIDAFKKNYVLHGKFVYFSFFYLIRKATNRLVQITDAFIMPQETRNKYLLDFATGLVRIPGNRFAMSYGVGDVLSKIVEFKKSTVSKWLKPLSSFKSKDYKFIVY